MQETAQLAGFFAAHGVWSVSDGSTLIPLLGYAAADAKRGADRFAALDEVGDGDGARAGREALHANQFGAARAVLVVDAHLNLAGGRTNALIVEAVEYEPVRRSFTLGLPYRPLSAPTGFAVRRPAFLEVVGLGEDDYPALADAFFAGIESHQAAAPVWSASFDPSG